MYSQVGSSNRALGLHRGLYLYNVLSPTSSGINMFSDRRYEFLKFWPFLDPKMTNSCFIKKTDVKTFKKKCKRHDRSKISRATWWSK